ncbi:MAG TPA: hypothetical protein VHG91_09360 [Longimicrobium sp.]|nr:hypothetical protein [Longimicrobium sp.]
MIKLVDRAAALRANPVLAYDVRAMQDAHDPEREHNRDSWESEEEGRAWFAAYRDDFEAGKRPGEGWFPVYTLADRELDVDAFAEELPRGLGRLFEALGVDEVTFLHVARTGRWPSERRHDRTIVAASEAFRALGAGEGFDGGIVADLGSLAEVVRPLFWSVRAAPDYGDVYFGGAGAPVVASLCQYGSLHLSVYGAEWHARVREAAADAGLLEVPDLDCGGYAPGGGRIPERQLEV